jgi:hypothetical protein
VTLPPRKICQRIAKLHGLMGSSNDKEAAAARAKLMKLLKEHGLSWNDLPVIIADVTSTSASSGSAASSSTSTSASAQAPAPQVNVFDLVMTLMEPYLYMSVEERIAVTLCLLHARVYERFRHSPRLAVLSPMEGCGKSKLLRFFGLLTPMHYFSDNITPATIYHQLDDHPGTAMLLDEGDNLGIFFNNVMRSVINSGFEQGGSIDRYIGGRQKKFSTYAPLVLAAIGTLPPPLLRRSVVIDMHRPPKHGPKLQPLDPHSPVWAATSVEIDKWAATCSLSTEPDMPAALDYNACDRWRILIAIADSLGHSEEARTAAIALSVNRGDDNQMIKLLIDIRTVFDTRPPSRWGMQIPTRDLTKALHPLEDGFWAEYRGPNNERPPHKLTQNDLAQLLKPFRKKFGLQPYTIWPVQRRPDDRSARGYAYSQFEPIWDAYCPTDADTPTQSSKIVQLRQK